MTDQGLGAPYTGSLDDSATASGAAGRDWLRQLDWREFEDLVGAAYRLQGYAVLPTSPGADGGIDLILNRGDERIFVQCKHWKAWQVGAPVIRELFGLVAANRATRGVVVASGTFSREAVEFARQTGTELLDGPAVLALVASGNAYRPVGASQPTSFPPAGGSAFAPPPPPPMGDPSCPVCLSPMVLHRARRGPQAGSLFWGCSRYPGCRGTRESAPGTRMAPNPRQLARQRRSRTSAVFALISAALGMILLLPIGLIALSSAVHAATTAPVRFIPSVSTASPSAATSTGVPGMGEQPMDVVIDATGKRLYTANFVSGDVTVIDTASMSVVDTIDVPGKPVGIAISGSTLYVADRAGKKVYAVSLKTGHTISTFDTGTGPSDLAVDPKAGRLFIAHSDDGKIWSYSLSSGRRLANLDMYSAGSIAVDLSEHKLYACNSFGVLYTYRTRALRRLAVSFTGAGGLAVDSKRQRLYVVTHSELREHNLLTGKSRPIDIDIAAQSVTIDPVKRVAYVADPDTNAVRAVSVK